MPFPSISDNGTKAEGSLSPFVLPRPTVTSRIGLLVAYVNRINAGAGTIGTPTGWTLATFVADANGTHIAAVFYRIETLSEPSTYNFFGVDGGYSWVGQIFRVLDFDPANPINATDTFSSASNLGTFPVPQPTTTANNCLVIQQLSTGQFSRTVSSYPGSYPNNHLSIANSGDGGMMNAFATGTQATAGQVSSGDWTIDVATTKGALMAITIPYGVMTFSGGTLSLVEHTETRVKTSWTSATGASGTVTEQLQRSPTGAGTWTNIAGATSSPFDDTTVAAETTYDYRVRYVDSLDSGNPVYSNILTVTSSFDPNGLIDATWLADNAAAFTGPPYLLGATFSNGGRSYAVPIDNMYRLAANVTTNGTAFVAIAPNVVFELDGHTITYDNGTPVTLLNGGFETADGSLGATFASNWNFTNAPSCHRVARNIYGFWGNWMLQSVNPTGTEYIISDPITLPVRPHRYIAWVFPKGDSNFTVTVSLVENGNESNILASSSDGAAGTGYAPRLGYECGPSDVASVRLKISFSGTGTLNLDFAGIAKCDVYGVVATGSATGLPIQLTSNTNIGTTNVTHGTGITITGPGSIVQSARSLRAHGFYGKSTTSTLTGPLTITTLGMETSCVYVTTGTGTFTNLTLSQDFDGVPFRQTFYAAINADFCSGNITITGCNVSGRGHAAIVVGSSGGIIQNVTISNNTLSWWSMGTDGYGIIINGVNNCVVSDNTITPDNGRGILLDSYGVNPSSNVTIENNNVLVKERANLEFGRTAMEATGLRIRSYAEHSNINVLNNTFHSETTIAGSGDTDQWVWAALGARIGVRPTTNNPYITVTGNTFKALVLTKDPALTGGAPSTAAGICMASNSEVPQTVANYYRNNIIESNHIGILVGDNDSYQLHIGTQVLINNTIKKSALGDQTMTFESYRIGEWLVVCEDLRVYSTTYQGGAVEDVTWGGPGGVPLTGQKVIFGKRLGVSVQNNGTAASGAGVSVKNVQSVVVHTGTTDVNGLDSNVLLDRQTLTWDGNSETLVAYTPFVVTTSLNSVSQETTTGLASDATLSFSFTTDVDPQATALILFQIIYDIEAAMSTFLSDAWVRVSKMNPADRVEILQQYAEWKKTQKPSPSTNNLNTPTYGSTGAAGWSNVGGRSGGTRQQH